MNWCIPRFVRYNSIMTLTLTPEQQQALTAEPNQPLQLVDDKGTGKWYVISEQQYKAVQPLIEEDKFDPREFYPLIAKTAAAAGWADPMMDVYDNYEPDAS